MRKDKKYVALIKAFQSATNAMVVSLEPSQLGITIYYKEPVPSGGFRYAALYIPLKN